MRSLGLFLVMTKSSHSIICYESCSQTGQVSLYALLPLSWPFDMSGAPGAAFPRVRGDFLFLEMHFNSETRDDIDDCLDRTARMHFSCFFLVYGSRIATLIKIYRRRRNVSECFRTTHNGHKQPQAATELLDRRATVYSDRPRMIVANEILSGGLFVTFIRYGDLCVIYFSKI